MPRCAACFSQLKRRLSGYSLHFKLVPKFSSLAGAFILRDIAACVRPLAARIRAKARELRLSGYVRLALPQSLARYSAWLEGESSGRCTDQDQFVAWLDSLARQPESDLLPRLFLRKSAETFPYSTSADSKNGDGSRGQVSSSVAVLENDETYDNGDGGGGGDEEDACICGGGGGGVSFIIQSDHIVPTGEPAPVEQQQTSPVA